MEKKDLLKSIVEKLRNKKRADVSTEQLNKKFDQVLLAFKETITTRILEKIVGDVEVKNIGEIATVISDEVGAVVAKHLNENGEASQKMIAQAVAKGLESIKHIIEVDKKTEKTIKTAITNAVEIKGEVLVKKDDTALIGAIYDAIGGLIKVVSGMAGRVFRVKLGQEHYMTPQKVVLWDLSKNEPIEKKDFSGGDTVVSTMGGGLGGGFRQSAPIIGDGRIVLTTAGTRQQLPDVKVSKVYIQGGLNNAGEVVIGGASVVADAASRQGIALSSTQWTEFNVKNLNRLYIDGTQSGDTINYTYESYE